MLLIDLYMMVGGVRPSRLDLERFVLSIVGIVIILSRVVLGFPRSGWSVTLQRESTSLYNITPMENSEKMDRVEDEKTSLKAFEAWMDEAGVDRRGSTRLRRFVGRGIGLEACRELERDSTVASIPRSCCFSSDTADAPGGSLRALAHAIVGGQSASSETRGTLDKAVMSVTLQVLLERMAGDRSEFAPWMAMLPRWADVNLPALWSEGDLRTLEGTLVLQEVEQCLAAAELERLHVEASIMRFLEREDNMGALLRGVIARGHESLPGRPTLLEWLHTRCIVQSRAYRVGGRYLLIPLVDFANHDDDIAYAVCPGDGIFTELDEVVLTADRGYRPGEEVCASYGDAMDNAKRLFSFGFVSLSEPCCSRSGGKIRLPNEAFCDVEFLIDASDPLRTFKEDVLRRFLGTEDDILHVGAVFRLEPCRPYISQIVNGLANLFLGSILPLLRLAALTSHDLMRPNVAEFSIDDLTVGGVVNHDRMLLDSSGMGTGLAPLMLVPRYMEEVLLCLKCPVSQENESNALRLLSDQCLKRLDAIGLRSEDFEALREAADQGHDSEKITVSKPRCLLVAAVRVGEAMAWHALLEAANKRNRLDATIIEGGETWASWISEQSRKSPSTD